MSEMAVTSVSMADAYSPAAASLTARAMALDDTVRLRLMTSSNSASLMAGSACACGACASGACTSGACGAGWCAGRGSAGG